MKKVLLATYTILLVLSLALLVWIIPNNTEDSGWGLSPALLPNMLAMVMLVTSAMLLWQTARSSNTAPSPIKARHLLRLAAYSVILFGTFPLMTIIGFLPGGILAMFLFQLLCGQRSLPWLIGLSIALPGVIWFLMVYVLQVPMPM